MYSIISIFLEKIHSIYFQTPLLGTKCCVSCLDNKPTRLSGILGCGRNHPWLHLTEIWLCLKGKKEERRKKKEGRKTDRLCTFQVISNRNYVCDRSTTEVERNVFPF
jgi:hypothetical protein